MRFMETEFAPPGFGSDAVFTTSNLRGAAAFYRVDPKTDRVLIRPERLPELLANRQYAVVRGEEMLASVPSGSTREQHVLYIAHPGSAAARPRAIAAVLYSIFTAVSVK